MEGCDVAAAPDHLVEAATALANLMASSPSSSRPSCSTSCPRSVVSDNDDDSTNRALKFSLSSDSAKREMFPHKLMAILNDPTLSEIVSWLPHGRSFVIIRPDVFTDKVLPQYLPPLDSRSSTKYPSFTRKLNRW
jgi:HSF-type DNA-binding